MMRTASMTGVASMAVATALSITLLALGGYVTGMPAWYTWGAPHPAMSPLTATALLALSVATLLVIRTFPMGLRLLPVVAICLGAAPLLTRLWYGDDVVSPAISLWLETGAALRPRTSIGTSIGIITLGAGLLPMVRAQRHWIDWLTLITLVISGTSLLGYAYGTLDLYEIAMFRSMALNTATSLFLLAMAIMTCRPGNRWVALVLSEKASGHAMRRQLLYALGAPIAGWLMLRAYRSAHLGVGGSLAIFVTVTTLPLIWLILRDGRRLADIEAIRRRQQAESQRHSAELQEQLAAQATEIRAQHAVNLRLIETASNNLAARYRELFEAIDGGFCVIEMKFDAHGAALDYRFIELNEAFEKQSSLEKPHGRWRSELSPPHEQRIYDLFGQVSKSRQPIRFQRFSENIGRWFDAHVFAVDEPARQRVGIIFTDITERKNAEAALHDLNQSLERRIEAALAEREEAQAALRQSQKMEAVGQLTGGLAHDFNNLLAGITGSLELLQVRVAQGRVGELDRFVNAAQGAARRAAALTHRLLTFSRRQTLDPKPTDVNNLVAGMEDLIRRTVGPEIAVEAIAAGGLWKTIVDQGQLENSLLNLCINARDAMPRGGKLVIETGNKWLDESAARERELVPGQYVTLCVSDNGCGMTPEIVARAFDPFFTTKPIGMGTGLGLSMIYGFAKQSGGQVRIYSEIDQGTMVCLWLPRQIVEVTEGETEAALLDAPHAAGRYSVLVVDDEPTVRMLVTEVLEELGYTAIEAAEGTAALKILQSDAKIDLLITDVGLPGGLNGRQVADAAQGLRPGLRVLFVTGYAENAVLSHGHLGQGMHVLTKPFRMEVLASRIKELLLER